MEIERKWLVEDWPETDLPVIKKIRMRQGYISVYPTVRIRQEISENGTAGHILCFKSAGGLSRKEIEMDIAPDMFAQLEDLIGRPLIPKTQRVYLLPEGLKLEVNLVDEGAPTCFMYAEVEYRSEEEALAWNAADSGLDAYLSNEVTGVPGQSMGAYWQKTRA